MHLSQASQPLNVPYIGTQTSEWDFVGTQAALERVNCAHTDTSFKMLELYASTHLLDVFAQWTCTCITHFLCL